jgi:cytochrome c-type biogenesis protein
MESDNVAQRRDIIFLNSVLFVIGFTAVFSTIGILLQTLLSHATLSTINIIRLVGGVAIIIFGILMVASAKYVIPFFSMEHKIHVKRTENSYLASFLFGIAFALGWTPCVGAILGSIYTLAATSPGLGFLLLMAYSLGLGIPFLIFGAFLSKLSEFLQRIRTFLKYFSVISGAFLVFLGILIVTGYIGMLSVFLEGAQIGSSSGGQLNFLIAIIAGLLTFLSPCILPLLPAYFSYMTGTAVNTVKK